MFNKYCNMGAYIPAPNLSNGFHGILFQYIKKHYVDGNSILLVAENSFVNHIFEKYFSGIKIDNNEYGGKIGEQFIDLNIKQNWKPKYDFVFSQALLEHVCRPCIALENMADATKPNGHIILHTQNPQMGYHAFPVDCLRFWKDWFIEIQKYLPIKLEEWNEFGPHLFCMYERL